MRAARLSRLATRQLLMSCVKLARKSRSATGNYVIRLQNNITNTLKGLQSGIKVCLFGYIYNLLLYFNQMCFELGRISLTFKEHFNAFFNKSFNMKVQTSCTFAAWQRFYPNRSPGLNVITFSTSPFLLTNFLTFPIGWDLQKGGDSSIFLQ